MEDKKDIKNENKKIHILSKEFEDRMIYEEKNIVLVEESPKQK